MAALGGVAGRSSQRKYVELSRSWRRRNWKLFTGLTVICGIGLVCSFIAGQRWSSVGWFSGVLGGVALAFFMIAFLTPPGWIENWQLGAWGEQATAKALRPLEADGWIALHDLPSGRGNVDHIVVGPGGVFLLDSKRWGGSVTVDSDGAVVTRLDDPELSYRHSDRHIAFLARQTHDRILRATRLSQWVTPVMVLWAEFPDRIAEARCVYVHGDDLVTWLRSRPQKIAPDRVHQVAEAVRHSWTSATPST